MSLTKMRDAPESTSNDARAIMEKLADTAMSRERLPMLDVVFDKLTRLLTESFIHLISHDVSVSLEAVTYGRFGDFMSPEKAPSILAIARSMNWENSFIIAMDTKLFFALSELSMGADINQLDRAIDESYKPTNIEMQIARRIFDMIALRMSNAFGSVTEVDFSIKQLELNPQFAAIARLASPAVQADLHINIANTFGQVRAIFPYTTLEPVKADLQQMFVGEHYGQDPLWGPHLERSIKNSEIALEAILHQECAKLGDVLNWKIGDTLTFNAAAESDVRLISNNIEFFRGPMGRKGGRIAARIDEMPYLYDDMLSE